MDKQLEAGAVLLCCAKRRKMSNWWLVNSRHARVKTVTWDIASTCTVSGKKGLLLVEAKAHSRELNKGNCCAAKGANRTQIDCAVEKASTGLEELTTGQWALSTRHRYQLSNRFAWSWKLAMLRVPVVLLYLGFLNARDMQDDGDLFQSGNDWRHTMLDYCRGVVDESCWEQTLNVEGVPLIPLVRVFEQPFAP